MASQQDEIDRAVKRHVGEAVGGLRNDIAEMLEGKKAKGSTASETRCKVTGPGYSEEFTTLGAAQKVYDGIKKRLTKSETAGTVKLYSQRAGTGNGSPVKWDVVQQWKATEDSFS